MPAEDFSIDLQPRDLALLRSLFESRIMTSAHVCALHFDGKREYAKKRLQKLKSAGLVSERSRRVYEPSILFLTTKAFKVLAQEGILQDYPAFDIPSLEKRARVSEMTVRHELEVMDVKVAIHSAVRTNAALKLEEFSTWPALNQFDAFRPGYSGKEQSVKPDGFIRIHETDAGGVSEHVFFLEVDRSTEVQDLLVSRAGSYIAYYKSGGFAVRSGATRDAFRDYPFRVLMVFKSAERRNNTAERLLQGTPPILTQVYLTTMDEVCASPLGSIWIRPADYRDATKGTIFDPANVRERWGYKSQSEREALVEKNIKKLPLLD